MARAYDTRRTAFSPSASSSLARSWISLVMSVPAGPPSGGLYLNPPSGGGLCEGVTTIPSAWGPGPPELWARMARDTDGVGVYPPRASTSTWTPLAASTSSALICAGSDSACVSAPRNNGPSIPCPARYSQMAWVVARMWSSLNVAVNADPRCPEVPNDTRWLASPGSGCTA